MMAVRVRLNVWARSGLSTALFFLGVVCHDYVTTFNSMARARSIFEYHEGRQQSAEPAWEPYAPAKRPCRAMPGTSERIAEYRRRLECGREMYHPDDKTGLEGE